MLCRKFAGVSPVTLFFNSAILMSGEWKAAALSLYITLAGALIGSASVFLPWGQLLGIQMYLPLSLPLVFTDSTALLTAIMLTVSLPTHAAAVLAWASLAVARARSLHEEKTGATVSGRCLRRVGFLCCVTFHRRRLDVILGFIDDSGRRHLRNCRSSCYEDK